MEDRDPEPIDYQNPKQTPPAPGSSAGNFGFGALIVIAATVAVFVGGAATHGAGFLALGGAWLVGIPVYALVVSSAGRRPGMAAGLMATMGVVLLIFGGLCFYALAHI